MLASQRPRKQRNLLCLKATIKFDRDLGLAQFPTEMVKNHGRGFHFFLRHLRVEFAENFVLNYDL